MKEEVVCGSRGGSSCSEPREAARRSQESVMLEPAQVAGRGLSSEGQQGDKDSAFQAADSSPSQVGGEVVVFRLALGLKADPEGRWSCLPLPPPGRKESGEIVRCELETCGCPWQKSHQIDHSWAGLGLWPLLPQPRPHPPQRRLRNPSQPVTGQYSSSRTLPSCPHSWSLLSWMESEVSTDKGASAPPPMPLIPHTHTHTQIPGLSS